MPYIRSISYTRLVVYPILDLLTKLRLNKLPAGSIVGVLPASGPEHIHISEGVTPWSRPTTARLQIRSGGMYARLCNQTNIYIYIYVGMRIPVP